MFVGVGIVLRTKMNSLLSKYTLTKFVDTRNQIKKIFKRSIQSEMTKKMACRKITIKDPKWPDNSTPSRSMAGECSDTKQVGRKKQ